MRNDEFTVRFGGAILPAMLHALMIGRNSALGTPGGRPVVEEMNRLYEALARDCGIPNLGRAVDGNRWFAACRAISGARTYHWYMETGMGAGGDDASLVVDGRQYRLDYRFPTKTEGFEAIRDFLERHAHLDAVKGETVRNWRPYEPPPGIPEEGDGEAEEPGLPTP